MKRTANGEESYFVCGRCDCKFFSNRATERCPRCGQELTSTVKARPPWLPRLYRPDEVAELLRCSISTVYSLLERGKLQGHRCPGWRVSEEDLRAYLDETKQQRRAGDRSSSRRVHLPRLKNFSL